MTLWEKPGFRSVDDATQREGCAVLIGGALLFIGILVFWKISGNMMDDLEDSGVPSKHRPFFILVPIVAVVVLWNREKILRWLQSWWLPALIIIIYSAIFIGLVAFLFHLLF